MKKKLIWGLILIIAASGIFTYNVIRLNHKTPVKLVKVEQGELSQNIFASGKLESAGVSDQLIGLNGKVAEVKVKKGDKVTKGQVLVVMDTSDIEQQIALEQNKLQQIKLGREQARKAQFEADRQAVWQGGAPEEEDRDAYASYDLQIAGEEIVIDSLKEKLTQKELRAERDGVVTELSVHSGQMVQQGMPALQITDISQLRVRAYLNELDANQAHENMEAIISGDAFADTYKGTLTSVAAVARPVDQTTRDPMVEILVSVDQPKPELKPGFNASVELLVKQPEKLLIPLSAVQYVGDKSYVYEVKDGRAVRVSVQLGVDNEELVQVLKGLKAGDEIIADVQNGMREGKKVKAK
ncbi:MAG TPA: efflux RND transporter periplasmic adaptor subunit [Bacilli bacterium]